MTPLKAYYHVAKPVPYWGMSAQLQSPPSEDSLIVSQNLWDILLDPDAFSKLVCC